MCISPACDCYRPPNGDKYLYIQGYEEATIARSKARHTQYCIQGKNIKWDASLIITESNLFNIDGYEFWGTLRDAFASRVIQRIWAYLSRVGVDTSEYIHLQRKE